MRFASSLTQPAREKPMNVKINKEDTLSGDETKEDLEPNEGNPEGDDFQVTVKKLELPVRPRGVLAE
jgi:hypothetical protein